MDGQRNPFAFAPRTLDPSPTARRFDAGAPAVPNIYMARAVPALLTRIGFGNVAAHVQRLTRAFFDGVKTLQISCKTPAAGLALAILVAVRFPEGAFVYLFGISLFGGLCAWLIIFVTHLAFRPKWKAAGGAPLPVKMYFHPLDSLMGAASMLAILATTWWVEGMRVTLVAGLPWLGLLTVAYLLVARSSPTCAIMEQ